MIPCRMINKRRLIAEKMDKFRQWFHLWKISRYWWKSMHIRKYWNKALNTALNFAISARFPREILVEHLQLEFQNFMMLSENNIDSWSIFCGITRNEAAKCLLSVLVSKDASVSFPYRV